MAGEDFVIRIRPEIDRSDLRRFDSEMASMMNRSALSGGAGAVAEVPQLPAQANPAALPSEGNMRSLVAQQARLAALVQQQMETQSRILSQQGPSLIRFQQEAFARLKSQVQNFDILPKAKQTELAQTFNRAFEAKVQEFSRALANVRPQDLANKFSQVANRELSSLGIQGAAQTVTPTSAINQIDPRLRSLADSSIRTLEQSIRSYERNISVVNSSTASITSAVRRSEVTTARLDAARLKEIQAIESSARAAEQRARSASGQFAGGRTTTGWVQPQIAQPRPVTQITNNTENRGAVFAPAGGRPPANASSYVEAQRRAQLDQMRAERRARDAALQEARRTPPPPPAAPPDPRYVSAPQPPRAPSPGKPAVIPVPPAPQPAPPPTVIPAPSRVGTGAFRPNEIIRRDGTRIPQPLTNADRQMAQQMLRERVGADRNQAGAINPSALWNVVRDRWANDRNQRGAIGSTGTGPGPDTRRENAIRAELAQMRFRGANARQSLANRGGAAGEAVNLWNDAIADLRDRGAKPEPRTLPPVRRPGDVSNLRALNGGFKSWQIEEVVRGNLNDAQAQRLLARRDARRQEEEERRARVQEANRLDRQRRRALPRTSQLPSLIDPVLPVQGIVEGINSAENRLDDDLQLAPILSNDKRRGDANDVSTEGFRRRRLQRFNDAIRRLERRGAPRAEVKTNRFGLEPDSLDIERRLENRGFPTGDIRKEMEKGLAIEAAQGGTNTRNARSARRAQGGVVTRDTEMFRQGRLVLQQRRQEENYQNMKAERLRQEAAMANIGRSSVDPGGGYAINTIENALRGEVGRINNQLGIARGFSAGDAGFTAASKERRLRRRIADYLGPAELTLDTREPFAPEIDRSKFRYLGKGAQSVAYTFNSSLLGGLPGDTQRRGDLVYRRRRMNLHQGSGGGDWADHRVRTAALIRAREAGLRGVEQLAAVLPGPRGLEDSPIPVTYRAPGTDLQSIQEKIQAGTLDPDYVKARHWRKLARDRQRMAMAGVGGDAHAGNILYDRKRGFTSIDYWMFDANKRRRLADPKRARRNALQEMVSYQREYYSYGGYIDPKAQVGAMREDPYMQPLTNSKLLGETGQPFSDLFDRTRKRLRNRNQTGAISNPWNALAGTNTALRFFERIEAFNPRPERRVGRTQVGNPPLSPNARIIALEAEDDLVKRETRAMKQVATEYINDPSLAPVPNGGPLRRRRDARVARRQVIQEDLLQRRRALGRPLRETQIDKARDYLADMRYQRDVFPVGGDLVPYGKKDLRDQYGPATDMLAYEAEFLRNQGIVKAGPVTRGRLIDGRSAEYPRSQILDAEQFALNYPADSRSNKSARLRQRLLAQYGDQLKGDNLIAATNMPGFSRLGSRPSAQAAAFGFRLDNKDLVYRVNNGSNFAQNSYLGGPWADMRMRTAALLTAREAGIKGAERLETILPGPSGYAETPVPITRRAPGRDVDDIIADLKAGRLPANYIKRKHWDKLAKTKASMYESGIGGDAHVGNLLYDRKKGFTAIDYWLEHNGPMGRDDARDMAISDIGAYQQYFPESTAYTPTGVRRFEKFIPDDAKPGAIANRLWRGRRSPIQNALRERWNRLGTGTREALNGDPWVPLGEAPRADMIGRSVGMGRWSTGSLQRLLAERFTASRNQTGAINFSSMLGFDDDEMRFRKSPESFFSKAGVFNRYEDTPSGALLRMQDGVARGSARSAMRRARARGLEIDPTYGLTAPLADGSPLANRRLIDGLPEEGPVLNNLDRYSNSGLAMVTRRTLLDRPQYILNQARAAAKARLENASRMAAIRDRFGNYRNQTGAVDPSAFRPRPPTPPRFPDGAPTSTSTSAPRDRQIPSPFSRLGAQAKDFWNRRGPGGVQLWRGDRVDEFGRTAQFAFDKTNLSDRGAVAGQWWSPIRGIAESYATGAIGTGDPRLRTRTVSKKEYRRAINRAAEFQGWKTPQSAIALFNDADPDSVGTSVPLREAARRRLAARNQRGAIGTGDASGLPPERLAAIRAAGLTPQSYQDRYNPRLGAANTWMRWRNEKTDNSLVDRIIPAMPNGGSDFNAGYIERTRIPGNGRRDSFGYTVKGPGIPEEKIFMGGRNPRKQAEAYLKDYLVNEDLQRLQQARAKKVPTLNPTQQMANAEFDMATRAGFVGPLPAEAEAKRQAVRERLKADRDAREAARQGRMQQRQQRVDSAYVGFAEAGGYADSAMARGQGAAGAYGDVMGPDGQMAVDMGGMARAIGAWITALEKSSQAILTESLGLSQDIRAARAGAKTFDAKMAAGVNADVNNALKGDREYLGDAAEAGVARQEVNAGIAKEAGRGTLGERQAQADADAQVARNRRNIEKYAEMESRGLGDQVPKKYRTMSPLESAEQGLARIQSQQQGVIANVQDPVRARSLLRGLAKEAAELKKLLASMEVDIKDAGAVSDLERLKREAAELQTASIDFVGQADAGVREQRLAAAGGAGGGGNDGVPPGSNWASFGDPNNPGPQRRPGLLRRAFNKVRGADQSTPSGFFEQGALSTIKYGLPSMALFGGFQVLQNSMQEAEGFERAMSKLDSQIKETFGPDSQAITESFSKTILDTAKNTGIASDEMAELAINILGAFKEQTLDFGDKGMLTGAAAAEEQIATAGELATVTGLPLKEVTDGLTAASLAFGLSFEKIGDIAVALEAKTGVQAKETISFVGDLAPAAVEAGFSAEEIMSLAAITSQRSGRTATALAESYGRVLPTVVANRGPLMQMASMSPAFDPEFFQAASNYDTKGMLFGIGRAFEAQDSSGNPLLSRNTRQQLVELLGGAREAQNIIPALTNSGQMTDLVAAAQDSEGLQQQRFEKLQQTMAVTFSRTTAQLRAALIALLESGLKDLIVDIASGVGTVLSVTGKVFSAWKDFNDLLGGMPTRVLAITAAVVALNRATAVNNLLSFLPGRSGAGARGIGAAPAYKGPAGYFGGPSATPAASGFIQGGIQSLMFRGDAMTRPGIIGGARNVASGAAAGWGARSGGLLSGLGAAISGGAGAASGGLASGAIYAAPIAIAGAAILGMRQLAIKNDSDLKIASEAKLPSDILAQDRTYRLGENSNLVRSGLLKAGVDYSAIEAETAILKSQRDNVKSDVMNDAYMWITGNETTEDRNERIIRINEQSTAAARGRAIMDYNENLPAGASRIEMPKTAEDLLAAAEANTEIAADAKIPTDQKLYGPNAIYQYDQKRKTWVATTMEGESRDVSTEQIVAASDMLRVGSPTGERLSASMAGLVDNVDSAQVSESYLSDRTHTKGKDRGKLDWNRILADIEEGGKNADDARRALVAGTGESVVGKSEEQIREIVNKWTEGQGSLNRLGEAQRSMEQNTASYQAGSMGGREYISRANSFTSQIKSTINQQIENGEMVSEDLLDVLAQNNKVKSDAFSTIVQNQVQFLSFLRENTNQPLVGENGILTNQAGLYMSGMQSEATTPSAKFQFAQQWIQNQREQMSQRIYAADSLDALRSFDTTLKPPPEVQSAMFMGQLDLAGINTTKLNYGLQSRYNVWNNSRTGASAPERRNAASSFGNSNRIYEGFASLDALGQEAVSAYGSGTPEAIKAFEDKVAQAKAFAENQLAGMKGTGDPLTGQALAEGQAAGTVDAEGRRFSADQVTLRSQLTDEVASYNAAVSQATKDIAKNYELNASAILMAARNAIAERDIARDSRFDSRTSARTRRTAAYDNWQTAKASAPAEDDAPAEAAYYNADADVFIADRTMALKQYDLQAAQGPQGAISLAQARQARAQAQLNMSKGDELIDAEIEIANAERAVRQAQAARIQSLFRLQQARSRDTLVASDIGVQAARVAAEDAKREFGADSGEYFDALAALENAEAQQRQSYRSRVEALFALKKARQGPDPVKNTQDDLAMLNQLMADATAAGDVDAQIQIATRLAEAQKAAADAQRQVRLSFMNLRRAELLAMDDEVGAARVSAQEQRQILADMISRGEGLAAINGQKAQIVATDKQLRDTITKDKMDEYQYLLDTDKITRTQYINYLEALKNTLGPGTDQFKELEVMIKRLKSDISGDLQSNLPTSLKLPTLYEVRRLSQTGSTVDQGGNSGYQDNRNVNITINVDDSFDPAMIKAIEEAAGVNRSTNTSGFYMGRG